MDSSNACSVPEVRCKYQRLWCRDLLFTGGSPRAHWNSPPTMNLPLPLTAFPIPAHRNSPKSHISPHLPNASPSSPSPRCAPEQRDSLLGNEESGIISRCSRILRPPSCQSSDGFSLVLPQCRNEAPARDNMPAASLGVCATSNPPKYPPLPASGQLQPARWYRTGGTNN